MCCNPTVDVIGGEHYLGRQAHEYDGAYLYWKEAELQNQSFLEARADLELYLTRRHMDTAYLLVTSANYLAQGDRLYRYRVPNAVDDVESAANLFVDKLKASRYDQERHTGPSTAFRYFFQAGYKWAGAELMYGPAEIVIAALRGAAKCYNQDSLGGHLAVQWSTTPHDSASRYRRYRTMLYVCYMQGLTEINTEEGFWHLEEYYTSFGRKDLACKNHLKQQQDFYEYVASHSRSGAYYSSFAFLFGRFDGWRSFGSEKIWGQSAFDGAAPEKSWELLRLFYPLTPAENMIFRHPCPDEEVGFHSGTPIGNADIVPIECALEKLCVYKTLCFAGYNKLLEEDAVKLLCYLPLGDLLLTFPMINEEEAVEYVRDLVFEQAVAHTRFTYHNTTYCREVFVSHNAQALVMRLWSDSRNAVTAEVELTSQLNANTTVCDNRICMEGLCPSHVEPAYLSCDDPVIYEEDDAKKGIRFSCIAQIETKNGTVQPLQNGRIVVSQADELVIKLVARSSFNGFDCLPYLNGAEYDQRVKDDLHLLAGKTYEQIKEEHIADFQSYYGRVEFALQSTDEDNTPTDERLRRFSAAHPDLHLYELIFQFGRYLMISCSREGTQPSTLQGIWNQEYRAPWSSNYTVNINTEMNYWPAESCNLSELHEPLFRLIKEIRTTGAETAKCHYGAAGVCSHHNTDIWRMANPVGRTNRRTAGYAYWCMSFGWLCQHLFEHYEYTLDLRFLEKEAYPAIRDAALFYLDMLTPDENGHLILSPSTSPENAFLYDGAARRVDITTTMTTAIIKEVFTNAIKCCRLLHKDDGFAQLIQEKRAKLKPYEIGASGRLVEWYEDYADFEVTHRHISHLYPLHPGHEITVEDTPELAQACKRSLESRADGGTGWSLGWKINCWTRLRDGDHAVLLFLCAATVTPLFRMKKMVPFLTECIAKATVSLKLS